MGGIADMEFATLPEKENDKFESILKNNKGEILPPAGYISAMEAAEALNKQDNSSDKYDRSAPMGISSMVDVAALKNYSQSQSSAVTN